MNNVDNTGYIPTVVAFCAGYGGIERGLDLAGVEHRVVAYVEIEAFAVANLVKKMEGGLLPPAPIWTDIKTFPSQLFRGTVDLITGGYPCQPFSAAGKRKGADDPRHLWPFISHHISIMRPRRVFFENVEGHISLGLNTVLADLEDRGFDTTWGIFSAREVGAPHQRKRVYILGDAEHNGPHGTALARSLGASICNDEKGEDETRESEGASPSSELADTLGTRSETGLPRQERPDEEGNTGVIDNGHSQRPRGQGEVPWPPEPDVGRVVNGVTDRVDRIRLLGNGVVPQTAAKAWQVLDEELLCTP
jgi:DNA (cytosine-5)-methyltransferase 1